MAKEIARLGIIFLSLLTTTGAGAVTVGDLLISEIMANPAAVSDTRGEWFELYNPTAEEINLRDIVIGDDGGDNHKIETDLLILPSHFLTLARNGDSTTNGGFSVDYVYDNFTLSNSGDEIVLSEGTVEWLRLEYGGGFDVSGRSRELLAMTMVATNYGLTLAGLDYGLGDIGTPGMPGQRQPGTLDGAAARRRLAVPQCGSGYFQCHSRKIRNHLIESDRDQGGDLAKPRFRHTGADTTTENRWGARMMHTAHHTYILASKRRGALFIGTTAGLIDCVLEHKANLIDGITSLYAIHQLVYFERFDCAGPALLREAELKQLPRCLKLHLIERHNPGWDDLFEFLAGIDAQHSRVSA